MDIKELFKEAVDSFCERQPQHSDIAIAVLDHVVKDIPLQNAGKLLAALMLFGHMMHQGPTAWDEGVTVADALGCKDEVIMYAANWLKHSNKNH